MTKQEKIITSTIVDATVFLMSIIMLIWIGLFGTQNILYVIIGAILMCCISFAYKFIKNNAK